MSLLPLISPSYSLCSQLSTTCLLEKDTCRLDILGMTARPWCLGKYLLRMASTLLHCFHIYQGHMSCMIGSLHCPAHLTCIWCTLRLLWNLNTNLSGSRYKCPRFCRTCQDRIAHTKRYRSVLSFHPIC